MTDLQHLFHVFSRANVPTLTSEIFLQWTISELACYTYCLISVPLYDTLGTEAISYIIDKGMSNTNPHLRDCFCYVAYILKRYHKEQTLTLSRFRQENIKEWGMSITYILLHKIIVTVNLSSDIMKI